MPFDGKPGRTIVAEGLQSGYALTVLADVRNTGENNVDEGAGLYLECPPIEGGRAITCHATSAVAVADSFRSEKASARRSIS